MTLTKITEHLNTALNQAAEYLGWTPQEALLLITFILATLALLSLILRMKKGNKGGSKPFGNPEVLERLRLSLDDLSGRFTTDKATLRTDLDELSRRLEILETALRQKGIDTPKPTTPLEQEEKKKTNQLTSSPPERQRLHAESTVIEPLEVRLQKSRVGMFQRLRAAFSGTHSNQEALYEALEEELIGSDIGVSSSQKLIARLREAGVKDEDAARSILEQSVFSILQDTRPVEVSPNRTENGPRVIAVIGVNGAGKTTTIGKLSYQLQNSGARVLVAACDTFRAAAVSQLELWAERAGVEIVFGRADAKPSTVAYEAAERAKSENFDVLIVDTAGRLHTRVNLMNELQSVIELLGRQIPGAPHETLLVLDGTGGQNSLQQAREFSSRVAVTGVVVTKLDGTPKGGIIIPIKSELGIPVRYIGVGEGIGDLRPFNPKDFAAALFAGGREDELNPITSSSVSDSAPSETPIRRKRRAVELDAV